MRLGLLFLGTLLAVATPAISQGANGFNTADGIRLYSSMGVIEQEGEHYGVQIFVIDYYQGRKILWRSAAPRLGEPALLDVREDGAVMTVSVPADDEFAGVWTLTPHGKTLHAQGPGRDQFDLKELRIR